MSMNSTRTALTTAAAQELATRRLHGRRGPLLAAPYRPAGIDDALLIQEQVLELTGRSHGGWKCSVPPAGGCIMAPIPLDAITRGASCHAPVMDGKAPVEPEIAYLIGSDLPPRATPYTSSEVLQAVASTHLAFELIASRYETPASDIADKLADSLSNFGLHLGPAIEGSVACEDADGTALSSFELTLETGTGTTTWKGRHPDGHPLRALLWLVNYLSSRNIGLRKGEVITTGSYHGLLHVPADQDMTMHFGTLGKLQVTIRPAA